MRLSAIAALIILTGCASSYNDTEGSLWNPFDNQTVGVTQLNERLIEISAVGNRHTSQSRVSNFVKLKAAEETMARGLTHFVFVSNEDRTTSAQVASTSSYVDYKGVTQSNVNINTNVFPGRATTVLMMTEEDAPPIAMNAQIIYNQLAHLKK
jgi:hypothetical protein